MIIWLIAAGEPLPINENNDRVHRMGLIANELTMKGHDVVWWTSTVNHFSKEYFVRGNHTHIVNDKFEIKLLHSVLYYKNISVLRIINHIGIALQFWRQAKKSIKPSLILCAFPTIEFSYVAIMYGKKNKVPVILDARDMWPDIFLKVCPQKLRIIARIILTPYFFLTRKVFREAKNIFAINESHLNWGIAKAGRNIKENDQIFPLAYAKTKFDDIDFEKSSAKWKKLGISEEKFIISYLGVIAKSKIDFDKVLSAAKEIELKYNNEITFVFCGMGDDLNLFKEKSKNVTNIIFPGWINGPEIFSLLRISAIGIAPYISRFDYESSVPNKPIEYFSYGLPVLSSLQGELKKLIESNKVGFHYNDTNELVNCIVKLKDDKSLYDDYSNNSLRLYHEKFNAELVYKNYADSIISIAHKNHEE